MLKSTREQLRKIMREEIDRDRGSRDEYSNVDEYSYKETLAKHLPAQFGSGLPVGVMLADPREQFLRSIRESISTQEQALRDRQRQEDALADGFYDPRDWEVWTALDDLRRSTRRFHQTSSVNPNTEDAGAATPAAPAPMQHYPAASSPSMPAANPKAAGSEERAS